MINEKTKFGFIAIIGETNSGKSTLVNRLVGEKVSIISHKVQTTRNKILGILTNNNAQLVFVDTPGVFKPKRKLDEIMISSSFRQIISSDIVLVLVDSAKRNIDISPILTELKKADKKAILVFNKIDKIEKEELISLAEKLYDKEYFTEVFMISALRNKGIDRLLKYMTDNLGYGDFVYESEDISNASMEFFASEITRENIYKYLHQELPYMIAVVPESYKENSKSAIIKQIIYVTSEAHRKIILGKNGQSIKRIGIESRIELEKILNKKVSVYLHIKVKPNWLEDDSVFKTIGLLD